MDWLSIAQIVTLTTIANGTPVLAQRLFGKLGSQPLDNGFQWFDSRPLFGHSKTIRGVVIAVLITSAASSLLGLYWTVGLTGALAAMGGDLLSSFVKRRLGLAISSRATGLDQIPESLLPALACASSLNLTLLDVIVATAIFFIGEIALSKVLYKMRIRTRPF
ncbi:MAG: CDP-archaeol synthase [Pseudolabrys sp.]